MNFWSITPSVVDIYLVMSTINGLKQPCLPILLPLPLPSLLPNCVKSLSKGVVHPHPGHLTIITSSIQTWWAGTNDLSPAQLASHYLALMVPLLWLTFHYFSGERERDDQHGKKKKKCCKSSKRSFILQTSTDHLSTDFDFTKMRAKKKK